MGKILVLTSIKPDPCNGGGHPSGLIWEVEEYLRKEHIDYDIAVIPEMSSKLLKRFHVYGFFYFDHLKVEKTYSAIFVYPDNMLFYVPKELRFRCIVLGPDSPGLRDARLFRRAHTPLFKMIRFVMYLMALYHEYRVTRDARSVLVVGRTDQLWMRRCNQRIKRAKELPKKIHFIRHPYLSKTVIPLSQLKYEAAGKSQEAKRFVFSGLINERYTRVFLEKVIAHLDVCTPYHFIVTGRANRWLADLIDSRGVWRVEYYDWVDDYRDLCQIGRDIHCLPDQVGAGTKNRCLTALLNGLEIVSTPIGIENIKHAGVSGIYIAVKPQQYAQYMDVVFHKASTQEAIQKMLYERKKIRESVDKEYERDMGRIGMHD